VSGRALAARHLADHRAQCYIALGKHTCCHPVEQGLEYVMPRFAPPRATDVTAPPGPLPVVDRRAVASVA